MKRRTIKRKVRGYLSREENLRRRRLWKASSLAGRCNPLPPEVLVVIRQLIPAAIRKTRASCVHDTTNEVLSEFQTVVSTVGMSLKRPGFSDTQYLFKLLCKAANQLNARYNWKQRVLLDSENLTQVSKGRLDRWPTDKRFPDPLQSLADARKVIETMPGKVRKVATLAWFEGVSLEQIAVDNNITVNAVNVRLSRARTVLSRELKVPLSLRGPKRRR